MKRHSLLAAAALVLTVGPAYAQATRTWVSGVGDDVNPCSRTAPCKTFAGAISKTAAGGEIDALDPGGFGAVTITKSITIAGDGTFASILSSGVQGVVINALSTDKVVLRNLSINGAGTTLGTNGVRIFGAKEVLIDRCTINNYSGKGIEFVPTSFGGSVYVVDSNITNVQTGVHVQATQASAVTLENTRIEQVGLDAVELGTGPVFATINNSTLNQSGRDGLRVGGGNANIANSIMEYNAGAGLNVTASGAFGRAATSTFANNSFGVQAVAGGTTQSNGRNTFTGNGSDGFFNGAALTVQ